MDLILFLNFNFSEPYHDIRYNLIAIVADKRPECEKKLKTLKEKRWVSCSDKSEVLSFNEDHEVTDFKVSVQSKVYHKRFLVFFAGKLCWIL